MANRRMISKTIIDSDYFLEMPLSAQCLYFHLLARADDDGFIDSPKKIMRMLGATEDDLKLLLAKQFIIAFESGVIVIKHWKIHNYIRGDRYKPTFYRKEKAMLELDETNTYQLTYQRDTNGIPIDIPIDIPTDIPMVAKRETQVRLGKDSIGKDNIKNISSEQKSSEALPSSNSSLNVSKEKPFITIPIIKCNPNDPAEYPIYEQDIQEWQETFPAVDVRQELKKIRLWNKDNPRKRKTKKGIRRHITAWLSKEQDKGKGSNTKKKDGESKVDSLLSPSLPDDTFEFHIWK